MLINKKLKIIQKFNTESTYVKQLDYSFMFNIEVLGRFENQLSLICKDYITIK